MAVKLYEKEREFLRGWDFLAARAHETATKHGFHDKGVNTHLGRLMLIVCEVAEAVEALRKVGMAPRSKKIPKFTNLEEELADIVVRVMDFAEEYGVCDVAGAILEKMEYNKHRPHMHGKTS